MSRLAERQLSLRRLLVFSAGGYVCDQTAICGRLKRKLGFAPEVGMSEPV
ncbi:MAG: hypothetical protein ABJD13_17595 [Paracoccaceae bacterium]